MHQLTRTLIVALPLALSSCAAPDSSWGEMFSTEPRVVAPAQSGGVSMTCPAANTQDTAQQLYDLYIPRRGNGGLPDDTLLSAMRPYLSDALYQALSQAKQRQKAQLAAQPEEKPDFTQGDLFSSLFEGPDHATVIPANKSADNADLVTLPIDFSRQEAERANKWEDAVVLIKQNGCWAVDDVRYGGNWDVSSDGTLRQTLTTP